MTRFRGVRVGVGLWFVFAAGCGGPGAPAKKAASPLQGVKIAVAAVGDRAVLATVRAQLGEWQASRRAFCTVIDQPVAPSAAGTGPTHVLLFRGDRFGDLVDAGALAPLPESLVRPPDRPDRGGSDADRGDDGPRSGAESESVSADALQFSDILPAFREQVSRYGADRLALPFGGSALVLVYNREAFERGANPSPDKGGLAFNPPRTWTELHALAGRLHGQDWDGDGKPDAGIALAFGADPEGVGDAVFLARAAALGQHRDHYSLLFDADTMAPRVASPPFVEALQGMVDLKAFGPPGAEGFDAEAARRAFRDGKAALLIDRAERAWGWSGPKARRVGVAPLPGSERVYDPANKAWEAASPPNRPSYLPHGGGWLVAVSASARGRERDAAVDFARYLVNPETSQRVRADRDFPVLPVRGSQIGQGLPDPRATPGVDSRAWSDAVNKTLLAPRVVPGLRIPEADGYLADLAKGRVEAMKGEPADSSLQGVDAAWTARTRRLGLARQLWHYRKSLNSLVTSPEPPAR